MTTPQAELTVLYDGGCPLCLREVSFLRRRDRGKRLAFVDVDAADYAPEAWAGISYRQAMARIHAIRRDGTVLVNVAVFREADRLIGLGWLYPHHWPLVRPLVNRLYDSAAKRLQLTGRADLDTLCSDRCQLGSKKRPAQGEQASRQVLNPGQRFRCQG